MNILVFFAHPDDETMLCGGTLALLAQAGAKIHVVCATRGEGGEAGEPLLCDRAGLGAFRQAELTCAVQALAGPGTHLEFMDYIDPTVGPDNTLFPFSDNPADVAARLVEALHRSRADVLISHGSNGEYGHPAHVLAYQAARLAADSLAGRSPQTAPAFYTFQAIWPGHPNPRLANQADLADLVLDVSPAKEYKTAAALCHRTQNALFIRRDSQKAGRQLSVAEVIMHTESLRRAGAHRSAQMEEHLRAFSVAFTPGLPPDE